MKIIWAIDAFEDNRELNQKMADHLALLYESTQADIEPLYLLRENEIIMPSVEMPNWVGDHSRTAESLFREVLADYNLPFLKEAKVIPHSAQSHAGAAGVLCEYAQGIGADLIIVGSHSREGLQRFFLGSFAESLMSQSEIPICVVGSHSDKPRKSKTILYPTEFGEHSKESFSHVLQLAKKLKAEILLLHSIDRPIEGIFELETRPKVYNYKGRMLTLEQIIENQIETQGRRAQAWINWAQREGVTAHFFIDSSFKSVDELVLNAVGIHEASLIVMEAQSGPLGASVLGSYTRNITRRAACPVYVIPRLFYDKHEDRFKETPAP